MNSLEQRCYQNSHVRMLHCVIYFSWDVVFKFRRIRIERKNDPETIV